MIGLVFGETNFPIEVLKNIKKKKFKYLIIDLSRKKKFKKDRNSYAVSIGQFGKIIKILKENKCSKVLFAGRVKKPNFSKVKLDLKGIYCMPRIIKSSRLGDAAILKEIIKILKQERISTISSLTFNPELALKKGIYSKAKPNREDNKDILGLVEAYKEIFLTKNLNENLGKLNGAFKENPLVKEVINFIMKDKKRSICTPFSKE